MVALDIRGNAIAKVLYETTDMKMYEIEELVGCGHGTLRAWANEGGWVNKEREEMYKELRERARDQPVSHAPKKRTSFDKWPEWARFDLPSRHFFSLDRKAAKRNGL